MGNVSRAFDANRLGIRDEPTLPSSIVLAGCREDVRDDTRRAEICHHSIKELETGRHIRVILEAGRRYNSNRRPGLS
jgi:hypothetical protein